ncbi:MAG: MFS transporter [Terriglobia bacterium]
MQAAPRIREWNAPRFGASAILHASFVLSGIVTTLLGPILPILSARWSLTNAQAGYFFASQFIGSMVGVGLSSLLVPRWGYRRTLVIAFAMMCSGVGTVELVSWRTSLASVFLYGIGLGLSIPATNLLVSDLFPDRRAAALNILGLAWGVGAIASPALTALALRTHNARSLFFGLAGTAACMAVCLAWNRGIQAGSQERSSKPSKLVGPSVWRSPLIPVLALMFFLYVGTENALSGWVATYAKHLSSGAGMAWLFAPSCFWAALLLGRAIAPAVLRRVADLKLMILGLLAAACGITTILAASTLTGIFLGVALSGLGLASVFPITIAALSHCFGVMATRVAGIMFAVAALGGATLPWLVGFLSTRCGSLRLAFGIPLLSVLVMLALQFSGFGLPAKHRDYEKVWGGRP